MPREVTVDLGGARGYYVVRQDGRVVARAAAVTLVAARFAPRRVTGRRVATRPRPAGAERLLALSRGEYAVGDRVITCAERVYLGASGVWVVGAR